MKQYSQMSKLQKLTKQIIVANFSQIEIEGLREIFSKMDSTGRGIISLPELLKALKQLDSNVAEQEVRWLLEAADLNGDGLLDINEFVAAAVSSSKVQRQGRLKGAFDAIDTNRDGVIDRDELSRALDIDPCSEEELAIMFASVDANSDGVIDYAEFRTMMEGIPELDFHIKVRTSADIGSCSCNPRRFAGVVICKCCSSQVAAEAVATNAAAISGGA
jgi:calcium-dependent protein kinase